MATVTECGLDFINKIFKDGRINIERFHILAKADNETKSGIQSRRGRMYAQYVKNAIKKFKTTKDFYVEIDKNGLLLHSGRILSTSEPERIIASTY